MRMKKTLYSLMLSEDVIREIDMLAHRLGTNRSNLVNTILAEHVQLRTPEQRVGDIFAAIEELMSDSRELICQLTPNAPSMELRSCLEYKYRPTVRYEVELFTGGTNESDFIGRLSVIFRTQSTGLIEALQSFFGGFKQIEDEYLSSVARRYLFEDVKLTRSIAYPVINPYRESKADGSRLELDAQELAGVISEYIQLFDRLMKGYICGGMTKKELADEDRSELMKTEILI